MGNAKGKILHAFCRKEDQDKLDHRPWDYTHLKKAIGELIKYDSINTILDVGFGKTARSTRALAEVFPNAKIVAIDKDYYALKAVDEQNRFNLKENVNFVFGDPELALPNYKFDLIVLSMVCHTFAYPFRAIGNLINFASHNNTLFLFVHRTDDFMKAVSAIEPKGSKIQAAKNMWEIWKKQSSPQLPYQMRFICEHDPWLSHYMELHSFCRKAAYEQTFTVTKESLKDVISEKRYSPLQYNEIEINDINTEVENDQVGLSLYVYEKISIPIKPNVDELINSVRTVPFYIADLYPDVDPLAEENKRFREEATKWFCEKTYIYDPKRSLPFGFYVDKRAVKGKHLVNPTYQLWPDEALDYNPPEESITLIQAFSELDCWSQRNFWSLLWVLIPKLSYWYDKYELMPGVLESDGKNTWTIVPYINSTNSDSDDDFIKHLKILEGEHDHNPNKTTSEAEDHCLSETGWKSLARYLRGLVSVLEKKEVVATYYMIFREPHDKENKPIAFSVQSTRWLDIAEVRSLAHTSKSALAAINWNITARQSAESEILKKHKQMLDLLQEPLESLTTLLNKTQEDAQTLRAILYDPHRSIFAAAPRVMKYFEQNRDISFGSVKWKAPHTAEDGNKETLANTIAAIVCEIFGKAELMPANIHELYGIANGLLNSDEKAFEELRKLFEKIVEFKEIPVDNVTKLRTAFSKLKTILFTPYKDGTEDFPLLPLLVVFYDFNEKSKVTYKALNDVDVRKALVDNRIIDSKIFGGLKLPVPRYSALLTFVSGVLAYIKSERPTSEGSSAADESVSRTLSATINDKSISIEFHSNVFDLSKLNDTFVPLKDIIEKNMRTRYAGNFQKPFFDFAGMCVKGGREGIPSVEDGEFRIIYEGNEYIIKLTATSLVFKLENFKNG